MTTSNIIKIDHFDIDDTTRTSIPTPEPVLELVTNTAPEVILVDSPTTSAQSYPKVMITLPHVRPSRNRKSTQQLDFVYSSYSGSFTSFIAYREVVCDPL